MCRNPFRATVASMMQARKRRVPAVGWASGPVKPTGRLQGRALCRVGILFQSADNCLYQADNAEEVASMSRKPVDHSAAPKRFITIGLSLPRGMKVEIQKRAQAENRTLSAEVALLIARAYQMPELLRAA
jgi:hypothetical protein